MTLDEAIKHASEVADKSDVCPSCATEHKQLSEWLKELKHLRSTIGELCSSLKEAVTVKSESCANVYHQFCSTCDRMRKEHFCEATKWKKAIEKAGWSETAEPQTEFPKKRLEELGVSPAPWKKEKTHWVADAHGNAVADCYRNNENVAEVEADAALIAAAPSLYEALSAMLSCAEKNAPYLDMSHMDIAMDMARKAIRKAGGEE